MSAHPPRRAANTMELAREPSFIFPPEVFLEEQRNVDNPVNSEEFMLKSSNSPVTVGASSVNSSHGAASCALRRQRKSVTRCRTCRR